MGGSLYPGAPRPRRAASLIGCLATALVAALSGCETVEEIAAQSTLATEVAGPETPGGGQRVPAGDAGVPAPSRPLALLEAEFYRGDGVLVRPIETERSRVRIEADGSVALNFANADVREVLDAVLGDTLGVNYIVDPRIQGTVTARTSRPLARTDVIPALESILALNGAALTFADGIYKVVPLTEAATRFSSPIVSRGPVRLGAGFGIQIIPLRFTGAAALMELLQPFASVGVLRADPDRNLLIYAGTGPDTSDLLELVDIFDVDWMAGMSFALIPVQVAEVKSLVDELEVVFAQDGDGPLAGVVRFLPIERLNAVLVISPQEAYLGRAQSWIERLDRGSEGPGRRIFVYFVKNGRAADLAEVLTKVFEAEPARAQEAPRPSLAPGVAPAAVRRTPMRTAEAEDQPGEQRVETAPEARAEAPTAQVVGIISESGRIRIIADEKINALLVLATPAEYRMIEATLHRLDILPIQVLIEATIAEVTLTDELRYGLQWFFRGLDSEITFSALSTGEVLSAFPGFSYLFRTGDVRVVLNALTQITDVNVISSPQLMVLDNRTARLQVGDEVPIATQSAVSVEDPNAPIVNTIQFRETGVILEVTPRVNASGVVVLDVVQEVSDVIATTTSQLQSPTIQQRRIESTIAVQSGDTIALGGLIRDKNDKTVTGVPLLSAIPILGNLFKVTVNTVKRTELLVLITPRVVRNRNEARAVTEELRKRMTSILPLSERIRLGE